MNRLLSVQRQGIDIPAKETQVHTGRNHEPAGRACAAPMALAHQRAGYWTEKDREEMLELPWNADS